jgi:thiol-disulfide isomerase/thioredoxin
MTAKSKTLLSLAIFAVFLIGAYFIYTALSDSIKPAETTAIAKKVAAPDFTVDDAQGNKISLSDFAGKPVVLNFWASWCPPCKSEMPHFNKVYAEIKDSVVFMMVDLVDGQRETQANGQQYVDEQGFTFPVYFDNQQQAATVYGISSIPTTFFIDAKGYIITGYQGAIDEETLAAAIKLITK